MVKTHVDLRSGQATIIEDKGKVSFEFVPNEPEEEYESPNRWELVIPELLSKQKDTTFSIYRATAGDRCGECILVDDRSLLTDNVNLDGLPAMKQDDIIFDPAIGIQIYRDEPSGTRWLATLNDSGLQFMLKHFYIDLSVGSKTYSIIPKI